MDTRLNMNTSLGNLSENINDVNSQLTSTSSQVGDRIESKLEEVFAYNKQVAENLQQENKALDERTAALESSKDSLTQMTGNIVASQTITFFVGFAVAIMAFYLFMRKPGYHPKV
jgi:predicted PurR-regulated permease PerM